VKRHAAKRAKLASKHIAELQKDADSGGDLKQMLYALADTLG
jgi:hypothetical protein